MSLVIDISHEFQSVHLCGLTDMNVGLLSAILPVVRRICHFDPHTCRGATLLGDIDLGDYNISIRAPVRVRLVVIVTVVEYVISIRVPV